jgi:hypothetical protein
MLLKSLIKMKMHRNPRACSCIVTRKQGKITINRQFINRRVLSSGIQRVANLKLIDVSEEHIASSYASYVLHVGFLLGLFFGYEDESEMFLRNIS